MSRNEAYKVTPQLERAIANFETQIGGREALVETLIQHDSPEIHYTVGLLADPSNDRYSLAKICEMGGISFGTLLRQFRDADGARAAIEAFRRVNRALPALAEDIMYRAIPHPIDCHSCSGDGYVRKPLPDGKFEQIECKKCAGTGLTASEPTVERQKLAAEIGRLLPKTPQIAVNTQNNVQTNNFASANDFRAFRTASDAVIFGQAARKTSQLALPDRDPDILDLTPTASDNMQAAAQTPAEVPRKDSEKED